MSDILKNKPIEVKVEQSVVMPRRILVAEDEHLLAKSLSDDLTSLGCEVIGPSPNGKDAIELAGKMMPDLALMDIRMPIMDGLAAGKILYQELGIPVVILSAFSEKQYLEVGAELGIFGYMIKPASIDSLRVALTVSWSRYKDLCKLNKQVDSLETKLANRKIIERAKGVIMTRQAIPEEEAMRRLQKQARDARKPMVELAQAVLTAEGLIT